MKRGGSKLQQYWRFFVDLHQMAGYTFIDPTFDIVAETTSWLNTRNIHNPNMLASKTQRYAFLKELCVSRIKNFTDVKSYLANTPQYSTMGSGRGLPRLTARAKYFNRKQNKYVVEDLKLPKNKWTGFLATNVDFLFSKMFSTDPVKIWVFLKPDEKGGKFRSIATTDLPNYLRMNYFTYYAEQMLKDCPYLPLFWSATTRKTIWRDLSMMVIPNSPIYKEPIDQSSFDANVSKKMIEDVVDFLVEYISSVVNESDALDVISKNEITHIGLMLKQSVAKDGVVYIDDSGKEVTTSWLDGLPSGLPWTALLGSICNYLQFREICSSMNVDFYSLLATHFQGDDARVYSSDVETTVAIYEGYQKYGLKVNPFKFWIEKDRDEFLRLVTENKQIRGYPARLITSILYRKPGSPSVVAEDWFSLLDSWIKLISRGAVAEVVHMYIITEASRIFGISRDDAYNLVFTPRSIGGGGLPSPKPISKYVVIDRRLENRSRFVGDNIVPMFQDLKIDTKYHTYLLNKYLSDLLPAKRIRTYTFSYTHARSNLRLLSRPFDYSSNPYRTYTATLEIPKWIETNQFHRDVSLEKYKNKQISLSEFSSFFYNSDFVTNLWYRASHSSFFEWMKGSLVSSPLNLTNSIFTSDLPDLVANIYWNVFIRLGHVKFAILVESIVQTWISEWEAKTNLLYGQ